MKYWLKYFDEYDTRKLYRMFLVRQMELFINNKTEYIGYDDGSITKIKHLYPQIQAFLIEYNNKRSIK